MRFPPPADLAAGTSSPPSPVRSQSWADAGSSSAERVQQYSGFRPEVQGLRAVAVLLVVLYHVFMGRVSGGVDIFLFISAFFMTLSFVRKLEGGRPLALGRYWLHTFKRLLPLATVVILTTLFLVWWLYPAQDVADFRFQGVASILYFENWTLAFNAVDYYAADHSSASPFQHFWSLSVQGQVFLVWPLIFGLAWLVKRRTGRSSIPVLATCFGVVFAASLVFSVITTHTQQSFAYFDTRARLWEFALGSLVALAIPYLRLSRALRVVLGWGGFVSMVLVGILVDVQGAFPGWIALWPLLSAAAIIVAGQSGSRWSFDRFLSWTPVVRMGDAAYALYLVHWPLLITYLMVRERPVAGPRSGVVIVVLSIVLALVLTQLVETPLKRWRWPEASNWRLALIIVVCMGLVLATAGTWSILEGRRTAQLEAQAELNNPGARVLEPGYELRGDPDAPTLPLVENLANYHADLGSKCPSDISIDSSVRKYCTEVLGNDDAEKTVLVLGNSHAQQWIPAIKAYAQDHNWRVIAYVGQGCFYTDPSEQPKTQPHCAGWFEHSQDLLTSNDFDTVFLQGTFASVESETVHDNLTSAIRRLTGRGTTVVGIRDNPRFKEGLTQCALTLGRDNPQCIQVPPAVMQDDPQKALTDVIDGYVSVDMTSFICPGGSCHPIVGNVYVFADTNHLSAPYGLSLTDAFGGQLDEVLG
ncbi:acyltransferase family protein [Kocuria sp. CPCC 205261]|uniref:acyltransferase family protein n=1 Tax=Kocuria sp. CPCC 205261 TaxID=3073554 RepID=UPI0034D50DA4